ncbi:MAG: PH domain-containing protein [Candidatus Bathyarchaeota archaeon]|nr:PH domain-containing protein [Candidatus Bathyarchaeota archaeon]
MTHQNTQTYLPHSSGKTKYYGLIFILIIAIPIGVLLYLTLEGPLLFSIGMSSVLLGVLAVLAYFTFSSGSLKYDVTPKEFQINFGLLKKRVPYRQITNVEKINLQLSLRLFGASLPGFHWGLFRTTMGNAHVYATKINGEFVLITLANGEKIALSPQEPAQFVDALNGKGVMFNSQSTREISELKQSQKRLAYLQVLAVSLAYVAFLGYFFWIYFSLPQIVPVHFGFDGVANRWADKSELLWLTGVAAIFPVVNGILSLKYGKYEKGMLFLLGVIFIVILAVFIFALNSIVSASA